MSTQDFPYKLGKSPARRGAVKLKMRDYVTRAKLPKPPATFGHEDLIGKDWGILGNQNFGDCVFAGAAHETMLWNKEANLDVAFTDQSVLSDYSAVTGFNPNDPSTDGGADMDVVASYRRATGILDAKGNRHKVAAYLALTPGDLDEIFVALYLFGAVGIGIEFPDSAMDQFNAGQPWDVVPHAKIEGGHYVVMLARRANLEVVTWGKVQEMTPAFLQRYQDQGLVYLSEEMLTGGKSLEGFDAAYLRENMERVTDI